MYTKLENNLDWIIGEDNDIVVDYYLFKNKKINNYKTNIKELVFDFFTFLLRKFKNENRLKFKLDDIEFRKRMKEIVHILKKDLDKDKINEMIQKLIDKRDRVEPYSLLFLLLIKSDIDDNLIIDKKMYLKYMKKILKLDMKEYSGMVDLFEKFLEIERERIKSIDAIKFYI